MSDEIAPLRPGSFDLVVIGSGAGSLTAAGVARRAGRRVALVHPEGDADPGPSTDRLGQAHRATGALVEAAAALRHARSAGVDGVSASAAVDPRRLFTALAGAVESSDEEVSLDLLAAQGVEVLSGVTRFTSADRIEVAGRPLHGRRFLLALGATQPSYGLDDVPHITPAMLPGLDRCPQHLIVAGNGTQGVELAQAFATLGSDVTLLHCEDRLLHDLEPEAAALITTVLRRGGVEVHDGVAPVEGSANGDGVEVRCADGRVFSGTDLLLAASTAPDTSGLGLELAGVVAGPSGHVLVDDRLRAAAPHVYAVGDCVTPSGSPHSAEEQAFAAVQHLLAEDRPRRLIRPADRLLRTDPALWVSRWDPKVAPVRMRTCPEVAHAGVLEADAARAHGSRARVAVVPLAAVGTGRVGDGFVKLVAVPGFLGSKPSLRLAGITVVGPNAGEVLAQGALAVQAGMPLFRLAQAQPLDGTLSAVVRLAASLFFAPRHGLCDRPAAEGAAQQPAAP